MSNFGKTVKIWVGQLDSQVIPFRNYSNLKIKVLFEGFTL